MSLSIKGIAHAITLWGVEYENDKLVRIWLTDSDDGMERLFSMSVIMDGVNNKMYLDDDLTDDFIYCQEYGYDVFIAEIFSIKPSETANWQMVPEPATAALSLLALAAMVARRRRK